MVKEINNCKAKILAKELMDHLDKVQPNPQEGLLAITYVAAYLIDCQLKSTSTREAATDLMKQLILETLENIDKKHGK